MIRWSWIAIAGAAALAWSCPTWAAEPSRLDDIAARGTLRIGTTGDYRPFTFLNKETGLFEGLDIDAGQALASAMGVKAEFVQTAWPNLMKDFTEGKFDIAMGGVSITLDRQKAGLFSSATMRDGKTPIARCENKAKFSALTDIDKPGVTLIVNPGGTNEKFARANIKAATIQVFPNNNAIFDEIVAGKADLMITDAVETLLQQRLHPELCAIHPEAPFDFSEKAYWLPRDAAMKAFVDQWLHIRQETGATKALTAKWLQ